MPTVRQMKQQMTREVREAAERADIMVGSVGSWPMSAMSAFLDACGRLSGQFKHEPIPMLLWCPYGHRHIDEGEFATKPHHTHACQTCGIVWRPAKGETVGVQFLPGYKNETPL